MAMSSRVTRAGGTPELDNYDELSPQVVLQEWTVTDAQLTGATREVWTNEETIDPVQDRSEMEPGQVAELVALRFFGGSATLVQQTLQGTTPGTLEHEVQIDLTSTEGLGAVETSHTDVVTESNVGTGNTASFDLSVFNTGNYGFFSYATTATPFNDTPQGTGGSGGNQAQHAPQFRNFRRDYGVGPLFRWNGDRNVGIESQIIASQIDTETVKTKVGMMFIWDLHEIEGEEITVQDIVG